jgi:hypothetical protein
MDQSFASAGEMRLSQNLQPHHQRFWHLSLSSILAVHLVAKRRLRVVPAARGTPLNELFEAINSRHAIHIYLGFRIPKHF